MRFLFVCGGTAGHINPALAIAGKLREAVPGAEFLFVGTDREMEQKLIPAEGYEIKTLTVQGLERGVSFEALKENVEMLKKLGGSFRQSADIIRTFRPDVAVGTGGYVCYPLLKKASDMGIPTVLHESNAIPGLTTRLLADKVDKILVAFPEAGQAYRQKEKVVVTGTPVRGDFAAMTKEQAREELGIPGEKPLVVTFWGSLGASHMNEQMPEFIRLNHISRAFSQIYATGGGDAGMKRVIKDLKSLGLAVPLEEIDIRPYINNMGTVMTAADLVMCRAGASTIAELTMMGIPSLLVPSPYVTNNHQEKNARAVEKAGGAKVLLEEECTGKTMYETVCGLVSDRKKLSDMSLCSSKLGVKDSAEKIAELILGFIN